MKGGQVVSRMVSQQAVRRFLFFTVLWSALSGLDRESWLLGIPAVAGALAMSGMLAAPSAERWRLARAPRFLAYFFWHSLAGGIDVARRAVLPRMPLAPAVQEYHLRLPPGSARVFLIDTVSLLPGTLAADLAGDRLRVHVLNKHGPVAAQLRTLEDRVAHLFALVLEPAPEAEHA